MEKIGRNNVIMKTKYVLGIVALFYLPLLILTIMMSIFCVQPSIIMVSIVILSAFPFAKYILVPLLEKN